MLKNMVVLPIYEEYVEVHQEILKRLNDLYEGDERFQTIYKEFEQEKVRIWANVESSLNKSKSANAMWTKMSFVNVCLKTTFIFHLLRSAISQSASSYLNHFIDF